MICAGTDLAPFRAFVQERALKIEAGAKLAPVLLFYGLSAPDQDDMYKVEFVHGEPIKAVEVRRAYAHALDLSFDCKYVQHKLWHDREDTKKLFGQDAWIYMCGAGSVGAAVNETISQIYIKQNGVDEEEAAAWMATLKDDRYWSDVFS